MTPEFARALIWLLIIIFAAAIGLALRGHEE